MGRTAGAVARHFRYARRGQSQPNAMIRLAFALLLSAAAAGAATAAEKATVCTITVNSADEREVFREHLPAARFDFVELAQRGEREWLGAACRRGVRCDVLVVSGHFAGEAFYSSKHGDHLPVDEMERVACSDSCPGLFSQLKEVYLFGCDTLKPEPVRSATPEIVRTLVGAGESRAAAERTARALSERHSESARDRMRRIFPGVPLIYGFSSLAPYGRVAGPMLRRHFETAGVGEVGSGQPSARLLKLFGPASMVATHGLRAGEPNADYRAEACRYYDERVTVAQRLAFVHDLLAGDMAQVRMNFDRIERFLATLPPESRGLGAHGRESYLAIARDTADPALRVRMISLARDVGWLGEATHRAELTRLVSDVVAASGTGFGEVDLVCSLNRDGSLDAALPAVDLGRAVLTRAAPAAALACLGNREAHARVLLALSSAEEGEVQAAQAYLRHRPVTEAQELREATRRVARMTSVSAQVRALETIARQHVADREVLDELARLFERAPTLRVQRAIAEIFLRAGPAAYPQEELAGLLRRHRMKSPDGEDLIDVLIRRPHAS